MIELFFINKAEEPVKVFIPFARIGQASAAVSGDYHQGHRKDQFELVGRMLDAKGDVHSIYLPGLRRHIIESLMHPAAFLELVEYPDRRTCNDAAHLVDIHIRFK